VFLGVVAGLGGLVQWALGSTPWLLLGWVPPLGYLAVVLAATLAGRDEFRTALRFLVVLPCIHFCWGIGFVLGYLTFTRNISAHTGR
jgi:hypothetical protein